MKLRIFGGVLGVLLAVPGLFAQTITGTITGAVTDASGAVVPGAHAVAHNLNTGVDSPATSNGVGLFRIDFLPIGRYQVSVQAPGFVNATLPQKQLRKVLKTRAQSAQRATSPPTSILF